MKIIIKVWILISVILVAYFILRLLDMNVSLKYEVYEPRAILGGSKSIDEREKSITGGITLIYIGICYVTLVIIGCIKFLGALRQNK